jgi:hypothetical protein
VLFSNDTSPAAERFLIERLRSLSPSERWSRVRDSFAAGRSLALAGLRARFPEATERELHVELARLLHGDAVAARVSSGSPRAAPTDDTP